MNYVNDKKISIFFLVLFIIIFIGFSLFIFVATSEGCWGTRALSMGWAFTGLVDNADSVYWNRVVGTTESQVSPGIIGLKP
jgi:hypothetical protein